MVNTLTAEASLITGPVVLGTLVKHYLERLKRDATKKPTTQLRRDELLYDEAFNVIKVSSSPLQFDSLLTALCRFAEVPRGVNIVSSCVDS